MSRLLALLALAPLLAGAAEPLRVQAAQRLHRRGPAAGRSGIAVRRPCRLRARAERGLIRRPEQVLIRNPDGSVAWQLGGYDFSSTASLATASIPACNARPCSISKYGLFEVAEGIYQVRGFDLANITFIRGDSGWIVVDTLTTPATARAAYELVSRELGERPIRTW